MLNCTDYALTVAEAKELLGIVCVPHEFRMMALKRLHDDHGWVNLMNLCSQLIGMANSVIENNREMVESILITEGKMHPHEAEKANLPTMFGALQGVINVHGIDQKKTCAGCAYRLGTSANQSPCTSLDAELCASDSIDFFCHMNLDENNEPTGLCAGHAQKVRA